MAAISNRLVFVAFLIAIFYFSRSTQNKLHVEVPLRALLKLREQADICSNKTGVPADSLNNIIKWPLSNDKPFKKFFLCVCHNSEYIDENGHFVVEKMLSLKLMNGTEEAAANLYRKCNEVTLEDEFETGYAAGACAQRHFHYTVQTS